MIVLNYVNYTYIDYVYFYNVSSSFYAFISGYSYGDLYINNTKFE